MTSGYGSIAELSADLVDCGRCPRLVEWRERIAREKRAAFRDETYWGRPVPGFGDESSRLVVIGLAPAAHGANRTGRMFTGDRSGEWLYRALCRAGFANQEKAIGAGDGLVLSDAWVTAPVRCAPPDNKPRPLERDACAAWFVAELDLLIERRVYLCLGRYGYHSLWRYLRTAGVLPGGPRPAFGHGVEIELADARTILLSYHPSQQNTFTGRLTEAMLDAVLVRAGSLLGEATLP